VNEVIHKIQEGIKQSGFKAKIVSIQHLPELQETIEGLVRRGLIDKHLNETYLRFYFEPPPSLSNARTIVIIAIPQPITRARFEWQGVVYNADIPPTYIGKADDARVKDILTSVLEPAGYKLARARLPVKTLAVRNGLARYGRNNISYVPGMGSFHRLVAFYSDCPCEEDNWQEMRALKACENCFQCLENCPTHCITTDRFLVHAENCLTWFNERDNDFPEWIKPEWHNALIGCLRCQLVCPVNKPYLRKIVAGPPFYEEETELILNRTTIEKLAPETRQKLESIAYGEMYPLLTRNLSVLIEKQRKVRPPAP
jgi:epoxyqueuosine reductase